MTKWFPSFEVSGVLRLLIATARFPAVLLGRPRNLTSRLRSHHQSSYIRGACTIDHQPINRHKHALQPPPAGSDEGLAVLQALESTKAAQQKAELLKDHGALTPAEQLAVVLFFHSSSAW